MITIGISGVGSIGAQHATTFAAIAGVRVVAWDPVASPDEISARTRESAQPVASFDQLLDLADGVVVAAPDDHHAEQVVAAADARRAVLVEKPATPTATEACALLDRVGDGAPVLVGYVLRHYRIFRRVHSLVAEGKLGGIVSFHATVGAYDTLRLAQQRFATSKPDTLYVDYSHEWDYLNWLVGGFDRCAAIAATRGDLELVQHPNVVDAVLAGPATSGTVHLDYVQDPAARELVLIGDRGAVTVNPVRGELRLRCAGTETVEEFANERVHGLAAQAAHFVEVVAGRAVPAVTLVDGITALLVAEGVRRSVGTGEWIRIGRVD